MLARFPSPAGERPASGRPLLAATAVTAACLIAIGLVGTLSMRHFGRVPFSVPSWPWYHSWPYYLFWQPGLDAGAALVVLPVALAAAAAGPAAGRVAGRAGRPRARGGRPGRRPGLQRRSWGWVLRWAAATTAAVLGLAGLLQVATGYDVLAAVAAVDDFWSHAPGTEQRVWWVWSFGDLIAFAVILGSP